MGGEWRSCQRIIRYARTKKSRAAHPSVMMMMTKDNGRPTHHSFFPSVRSFNNIRGSARIETVTATMSRAQQNPGSLLPRPAVLSSLGASSSSLKMHRHRKTPVKQTTGVEDRSCYTKTVESGARSVGLNVPKFPTTRQCCANRPVRLVARIAVVVLASACCISTSSWQAELHQVAAVSLCPYSPSTNRYDTVHKKHSNPRYRLHESRCGGLLTKVRPAVGNTSLAPTRISRE
jgi:hypothetical protein